MAHDLNAGLPSALTLTFPGGAATVALADLQAAALVPELAGVGGDGTTERLSWPAPSPSGTPQLTALAQRRAADWYLYQLGRAHVALDGVQPWQPDALSEVEWEQSAERITTRARRGPWGAPSSGAAPETFPGHVTYVGGRVTYLSETITYDAVTEVYQGGPTTITYNTDVTLTVSPGDTYRLTGGGTLWLDVTHVTLGNVTWVIPTGDTWVLQGDTWQIDVLVVNFGAGSQVTYNGYLAVCGYFLWCVYAWAPVASPAVPPANPGRPGIDVTPPAGGLVVPGVPLPPGGPAVPQTFIIRNTSTTDTVYLTDEDTGTAATQRFRTVDRTPAVLPPGHSIPVFRDPGLGRWRTGTQSGGRYPPRYAYPPFTTDQNNLLPGANERRLVLRANAAGKKLTGIAPPPGAPGHLPGRRLLIEVDPAGNPLKLANNDPGSSAANRFYFRRGADLTLPAGSAVPLVYDEGTPGWLDEAPAAGSLLFSAKGDLPYYTGSAYGTLGAGANGTVLTADSTAAGGFSWQAASGMANPMTTLGDIIYEDATPTPARLPGNTTATRKFLRQTGTGAVSAAPAWDALAAGDLPAGTATAALTNYGPGPTTNAFAVVFDLVNANGCHGSCVIKNTHATNGLLYKWTVKDMYGNTGTATGTVNASSFASTSLDSAIVGANPYPYQEIKLEVEDSVAGNHATYSIYLSAVG